MGWNTVTKRGILQYSYYYSCYTIEEYPSILTQKWSFNPHFFVCANIRIKLTFYFYHYHHRDHLLVCIFLEILVWPPLSWLLRTFSSLYKLLCGFHWLYFEKCDQGNLNLSLAGLNCQTTWPASWEICRQVRKQQLEQDMEQHTGSK